MWLALTLVLLNDYEFYYKFNECQVNVEHLDFKGSIADAPQVISQLIEKRCKKSKLHVFLYIPMQLVR